MTIPGFIKSCRKILLHLILDLVSAHVKSHTTFQYLLKELAKAYSNHMILDLKGVIFEYV